MASPHEKLAKSLKALRALQDHGVVAVRSGDLTRTHRERLVKNGFLQGVMKGWTRPWERGRHGTHNSGASMQSICRSVLGGIGASLLSSHYCCMPVT
jgi:hypothetical protein